MILLTILLITKYFIKINKNNDNIKNSNGFEQNDPYKDYEIDY